MNNGQTGDGLYGQLTIDSRAGLGKFHEKLFIVGLILNIEPTYSRAAFIYIHTSIEFRLRNSRSMIRA